jgi:hypothetical protein
MLGSLAAALAIMSLVCECRWAATGRVVDSRCVHAGVRPASDSLDDFAVTVQVTTDYPARCERR